MFVCFFLSHFQREILIHLSKYIKVKKKTDICQTQESFHILIRLTELVPIVSNCLRNLLDSGSKSRLVNVSTVSWCKDLQPPIRLCDRRLTAAAPTFT